MAKEACEKYKINKLQARRVYEILRLKNTNTSDKNAYLKYRLNVKNRLNAPFQVSFLILFERFYCSLLKLILFF